MAKEIAQLDRPSMKDSAKQWLNQIMSRFDHPGEISQVSRNACIYRVTTTIRDCKPPAYDPLVISFGPYHHQKNPKLFIMDEYKIEAVHRMLARLNKHDVHSLIEKIQELETKIRECYAEPIEWDGQTLSWMLAMDACFILEFFRSPNSKGDMNYFSSVFQNSNNIYNSMYFNILDDIMKLENQIPLFILETLLQLEFGTPENATTELAQMLSMCSFFDGYPFLSLIPDYDATSRLKKLIEREPPPCHLVDLSRMVIKDRLKNSRADTYGCCIGITAPTRTTLYSPPDDDNRTAQLLQGAGIKFQPGKIGFEKKMFGKHTLSLPQIIVDESTETYLRNLMAYEECQRRSSNPEEPVISQYVYLFDDLIDSEKDVSILKKSLVIRSFLASDEDVARLFNHIKQGIILYPSEEIEKVMRKVMTVASKHYNSRCRVWISEFKEEYCSKPWYFVSLIAATLILGMTAVQTVYSVKK